MNDRQIQAAAPKRNPQIEAKLNEYIEARRSDLAYYSRLVPENPARAVRILMLRDMQLADDQDLAVPSLLAGQPILAEPPSRAHRHPP